MIAANPDHDVYFQRGQPDKTFPLPYLSGIRTTVLLFIEKL